MKSQFILLILIALVSFSCKQEVKVKPNIIYIMSDDHSYQAISAYDDRYINTPNIDRIATEGAIYTNSFVTNSICSPSRAVMLTGKFNHANGQVDNRVTFDGAQQTYPKILQEAGYSTAMIGKWHLKSDPTGFDYWTVLPGQGDYYNPVFIEMGEKKTIHGYVTTITTDIALDWIDNKRDKSKPFCLLLHNKAPHRTWMPDTADLKYFNKDFSLPQTFFDEYKGRQAAKEQKLSIRKPDMDLAYDLKMIDDDITTERPGLRNAGARILNRMDEKQRAAWDAHYDPLINRYKRFTPEGNDLDIWKYQRYMKDYMRCVKSVDDNVGRLLDYLDENGLTENTIVVYTSDQGFYMGEHGWFDKRFMYEESFRTPLLMRYPAAIKPGSEITELVQNIDYAPTLLDVAGIKTPKDMHGVSLTPLWDKDVNLRDAIYYHYYEFPNEHMVKRHYGIRTDRFKLIHFYNDIDVWELYDLKYDPNELNNMYDNPDNAELIKTLKKQLIKLQEQYGDTDRSTY